MPSAGSKSYDERHVRAGHHRFRGWRRCATGIHEPVPAPDDVLAYSESIDLPELRSTRIPVVAFAVATVALAAAVTGWFLLRPAAAAAIPRPSAAAATTPAASPPASPPTPSTAGTSPKPSPTPPEHSNHPRRPADRNRISGRPREPRQRLPDGTHAGAHLLHRPQHRHRSRTQHLPVLHHRRFGNPDRRLDPPQQPRLHPDSAISTIGAAVTAYCPQYLSRIGG